MRFDVTTKQSNKHFFAANSAFLAVKAGNISTNAVQKRSYYNYAQGQLERLIGRTQRGYVIGVGTNSPKRPYHRGR